MCYCCHIVFFPSERNLKIYLACVTGLQNVLLKQVICDIISLHSMWAIMINRFLNKIVFLMIHRTFCSQMWAHETERVQLKLKNMRWYFFCDILQFSNITWGFEESWNFFAFFIKEETNLLGLLMKEAGCKYFMMRAVKKYWMDRQHWRAAFVLHQNTRKFYLEIVVCYFRKRDRV